MDKNKKKKTIENSALNMMLDRNTKEINRNLSISMAICFVAMVVLLLMVYVFHIFDFSKELRLIIGIVGAFCTLSPLLLYLLKVPDVILKFYILVAMQVLVTLLGTNNGIGIYITFVLVPIASCAYLNKQFTRVVTVISYCAMTVAVYFNTTGKLEIKYMNWSHFDCFRAYIIGFTIEYIIIYLFIEVILGKANKIVEDQEKLVTELQSERESYELLLDGTDDTLFKYVYETDEFFASDVFLNRADSKQPITIENFSNTDKIPKELYEIICKYAFDKVMLPETEVEVHLTEELCDKHELDENKVRFYSVEGRVIYDTNGAADRFIGLVRDITIRTIEERKHALEKQTDRLTGMYLYSYMKKYIESLPECYHEGMMLAITVLNYDKIVDVYGFIYGDAILKKIKQLLYDKADRKEFCCRRYGATFLFYKPSMDYIDGYQLQQDMLKALSTIYVGEKTPNSLKCEISYGQVNAANIDDFLNTNRLDYKKSISHKRNRNLYELLRLGERELNREEREYMHECQLFTNSVSELLRGAKDAESTIKASLYQMMDFYGLDRIMVLQGELEQGQANTAYELTTKPEYALGDYFGKIDSDAVENIEQMYDKNGYMVVYKDEIQHHMNTIEGEKMKELHERVSINVLLGAQLWIPTKLSEGEYTGAWHMDRCDGRHYSPIEIFWIAELINTIMVYIRRVRADSANRAKTNFISVLSHEIRTPMNAVIGLSEISLRSEMDDELRSNIESIHSAGVGLLGIVNDVLDFSKIESGKMEIIADTYEPLSMLNDVCVVLTARNRERGLDFRFEIDKNIPHKLRGDMVRIRQILVNLGTNAVKYTDKGYVKVSVRCEAQEDNITNLIAVFEDSGIGIKQEDIAKLFKNFGQVDTKKNHKKEGTGLGLAICKQLVDMMEGDISVQSVYGEGSVFTVIIPQSIIDSRPSGTLKEYSRNSRNSEIIDFKAPEANILVVDDTDMNLKIFKRLLEPLKMNIDTVSDGKAATVLAAGRDYDIIFMDHMMTGMDGIEATEIIRKAEGDSKHTTIISLSANATIEAQKLYANSGMDGFVSKPIRMKEILTVLRKFLPDEKIIHLNTEKNIEK